jgi:hypothetical protein
MIGADQTPQRGIVKNGIVGGPQADQDARVGEPLTYAPKQIPQVRRVAGYETQTIATPSACSCDTARRDTASYGATRAPRPCLRISCAKTVEAASSKGSRPAMQSTGWVPRHSGGSSSGSGKTSSGAAPWASVVPRLTARLGYRSLPPEQDHRQDKRQAPRQDPDGFFDAFELGPAQKAAHDVVSGELQTISATSS